MDVYIYIYVWAIFYRYAMLVYQSVNDNVGNRVASGKRANITNWKIPSPPDIKKKSKIPNETLV